MDLAQKGGWHRRILAVLTACTFLSCTGDTGENAALPSKAAPGSEPSSAPPERSMPPAVGPGIAPQATTYEHPPQEVVDIVDAKPTPVVMPSPDGQRLLLAQYDALPSIEVVAQPFERLAGLRIDPKRHASRRLRLYNALQLVDIASGKTVDVALPDGVEMGTPKWSYDGKWVAFTRWEHESVTPWVVDVQTGKSRQLAGVRVNDVVSPGLRWMPGSASLLVWLVPENHAEMPERPRVPGGPLVEDTKGRKATNRTYQDLLENAFDEVLFTYFATAQLARITLDGTVTRLGDPAIYTDADPSPDGEHLLVHRIRQPYSYAVPYYDFSRVIEVLDRRATVVRTVADQDAAEEIPIGGVRTGARDVHWRAGQPSTLVWSEALDGGDPKKKVERRDRLMTHAAPFADVPTELTQLTHRLVDVDWTSDDERALLNEYDRDRRWITTWLYDFETGSAPPRKLIDRSVRDIYGDPGRPIQIVRGDGTVVVEVTDGSIHVAGDGASPDGERPFVDRMALADGATHRVFEGDPGTHTAFVEFVLTDDHENLLVRRESPTEPPNYYVWSNAGPRQVTDFADPHPQLTGIEKRILKYKRRDGVQLSGTLYLPPGYTEGRRLPLVVWAYPIEFNDKDTAGQIRAAPNRFTRLSGTSPLMFLTQGYAVLDDAAMPVVGHPETMNDTFIRQIIDAASAAVDAAVAAGVADPQRVGLAGHSYGAFMTANLLAHSGLFQAGIARSGAYNRTLTPFGFQSERRTLWEAPQTYVKVSPLFSADKIRAPLLLIHGEVDANSGTYPMQSQRMFQALQGSGATARLVLLPHESHGYVARESVMHVLAESFAWFDQHVKGTKLVEQQAETHGIPAAAGR
jgi:dipeptidyl aminopeptidase/acylaminoacyl peptidase